MLKADCFKNVDVAMMAHPMKSTTLMSKLVNLEGYDITFHGRAMHAAEAPWNGVNALDAAAVFYNAVAMLRQQLRDGSRVHMIVTDGGDAVNIIPERAALRVEIRHSDFKYFRELVNKVLAIAEQAAKAAGCTVDIEIYTYIYYCMKNNRPMIELFKRHMLDAGITEYVEEAATGGGCTDMGNVSQEVPSIHPWMKMARPTLRRAHARVPRRRRLALRDRTDVQGSRLPRGNRRGHHSRAEAARRHQSRVRRGRLERPTAAARNAFLRAADFHKQRGVTDNEDDSRNSGDQEGRHA